MRYKLPFILAVAGLTALAFAPDALAQRWRETNLCDVPSVDFPTIQSAIDEPLCFTVRLGVATFKEQLTIHRNLTLTGQSFERGDERFVSRLHPPDSMAGPVLINVVGARTRAKIKHIVIERGDANPDGLIGIWAGRDSRVTIRDCTFRNMRPPAHDARWAFLAMFLGGALQPKTKVGISAHVVSNCVFDGYQNHAIVITGSGTTAIVDHNLIDANGATNVAIPSSAIAPIGIIALDGASVLVDRNDLVDNSREGGGGAAVALVGAAATSVVRMNNIVGNYLGVGVDGMSGAVVNGNHLTANDWGIWLGWGSAADANSILDNVVEKGGTGLYLDRGNSNSISENNLTGNIQGHGAIISAASTKNRLYHNRAEKNGGVGFVDFSSGSGTGGTANTYTSNLCSGNNGGAQSSPAGLCRK